MQNKLISVSEHERIVSLDVMRGLAILGIFLVNMLAFHSPLLYINPEKWWESPVDRIVYGFIDIFVQASFYPLFSMLFGYGLVIIRERSLEKGINFTKLALRRLGFLLVLGCFHAFVIWEGDILILYSLFGFISLLFLKLNGRNLMLTGVLFYTISNVLISLFMAVMVMMMPQESFEISNSMEAGRAIEAYQNGDFQDIARQRFHDWYYTNNLISLPIFILDILPLFLIGAGAAKLGWISKPAEHAARLKKILLVLLPLGVFLKILPYITERNYATDYLQDIFGGSMLAVSYAILVTLFMEKEKVKKYLNHLAPVGKMSMTNYLFQSITATTIFYSYGLGLYGKVSVTEGTVLAIIIFSLQVLLSRYWVKRYYYGPVEWIWRTATYGKRPNFKRNK